MLKRIAIAAALFAFLGSCSRPQPSTDTVFVSNEAGYVTLVDGATGRIEGRLATGARPRGMDFSPDGKILYVAASDAGRLEAWDARSHERLGMFNSGSDPERFAISPDGSTAYIASEDHSAVTFLDLKSDRIIREVKVGPEPEGIGVSPDGRLVVATSEVANLAHFIDAATGDVLESLPVGSRPRFVLFLDGGKQVWVSSEQRGTISVFDAATRRHLRTMDLTKSFDISEPVQAVEMRTTKDERRVFVAMGRSNRVAELDPASGALRRWWPTGERTWGIGLSPDETRLYAVSGISGTLTIIGIVDNKVLKTVQLGGRPWGALAARK
ncbi:MAG TPA: PQQ-dependent catabolism-associated beta-propeller protein [Sphingomicrobium sp.]|nr:PQQ-dependent catabolism-associated beta-propeller protein [Sphingomicrobium sp.]